MKKGVLNLVQVAQDQKQLNKEKDLKFRYQTQMAIRIQRCWFSYKAIMILRGFLYKIRIMQAGIRGYLQRANFKRTVMKIIMLQRYVREYLRKLQNKKNKKAIINLQSYFKRVFVLKYVIVENAAVVKIQNFIRSYLHRKYENMYSLCQQMIPFDSAWKTIQNRMALRIQKYFRGYLIRLFYEEEVSHIKMAGFLAQANKAAVQIQRHFRAKLQRQTFLNICYAVRFIQGYVRMRWLRDLFLRVRYASIVIQRAIRSYQKKNKTTTLQLLQIINPMEQDFETLKQLEFTNMSDNSIVQLLDDYEPKKKFELYTQIVDLELLTDVSDIYENLWSYEYKKVFKDSIDKGFIQTFSIGEAHTFATTSQKIYCWGLNDAGQTLKPNIKVKTVKSGCNHSLFLTNEGVLYNNTQAVLKDVKCFTIYNENNYAADENNIYQWKFNLKPKVIQKMKIQQISAGLNFYVALSHGQLFSSGENNCQELGHQGQEFSQVDIGEKIVEIHCGMKHSIARSSLGRVYTWGWNQRGQLGLNHTHDSMPQVVALESKAIQVMAGHKSSIVLLDNRRIFWWGSNSCLQYQQTPIEYICNDPPVRILSSWSRTISVLQISFAKCQNIQIKLRNSLLNQLIKHWSEQDIFSIEPPYLESLANYFIMKKPACKPNIKFASKLEHQNLVKLVQDQPSKDPYYSFQESRVLQQQTNLQKQPQIDQNSYQKPVKQEMKINIQQQLESEQKMKQLREVKKRYESIMMKDHHSKLDQEFLQVLYESDLIDLINSL